MAHDLTPDAAAHGAIALDPLAEADFDAVARLADAIWRAHYVSMIGMDQIDYMLAGRYAPERLRAYVGADDRWMRVLRVDGAPSGYCSWSLDDAGGAKLEQLYLLPSLHGRGLGGAMLRHVEDDARARGRSPLWLTVNKGNAGAIALYRKAGFAVREEAVFDIGGGYVMDDYVMAKPLG